MAERKVFKFYKSYYDVYNELDDSNKLLFMDALLNRQFNGIEPNLKGMAKFAYISQKHNIDTQVAGFESKVGAIEPPTLPPTLPPNKPPALQIEEEVEEEIELEEEKKGTKKKIFSDEIRNFTGSLTKFFPKSVIEKLKIPQKNSWCDTVDKLIRLDGFTQDEIKKAVENGRKDELWGKNFFSLNKLRVKNVKQDINHIHIFLNLNSFNGGKQIKPHTINPDTKNSPNRLKFG